MAFILEAGITHEFMEADIFVVIVVGDCNFYVYVHYRTELTIRKNMP
jgi:hypothetical protein